MRRRQLLKQIGVASTVALGATGIGSARTADEIASELKYVTTEIDGETRRFTPEEFDRHPDTQSLVELSADASICSYNCCECCNLCCPTEPCACAGDCGSCPGC